MSTFRDLDLMSPLLRALDALEYETPTPIQASAIPPLLEGRDVLGCAQTGTGKTAAFALPVLQHLASSRPGKGRRPCRALVLSPTRELAAQIGDSFAGYARFVNVRHCVIFGGVSANPQIKALQRGVDVIIATPGRLLDLQGQGYVDLSHVDFFILDEADRMLDMGFLRDLRKIIASLPEERQNLLFSATMPDNIVSLANDFLDEPVRVEVDPESSVTDRIEQHVMFVEKADKRRLLVDYLSKEDVEQGLVFTRTKHGANRLVKQLMKADIQAAAIHGNKSQNARTRALKAFRDGDISILVATDIASRGLDIDGVSHVFNYELPNEPESYVHRIGRTARAGRTGVTVAFCDPTEGSYLRSIEALTGVPLIVSDEHPWHCEEAVPPPLQPKGSRRPQPRSGGPKKRNNRSRRRPSGQRSLGQQSRREGGQGGQRSQGGQQSSQGASSSQGGQRRRRRRRPSSGGQGGGSQQRQGGASRGSSGSSGSSSRRSSSSNRSH